MVDPVSPEPPLVLSAPSAQRWPGLIARLVEVFAIDVSGAHLSPAEPEGDPL